MGKLGGNEQNHVESSERKQYEEMIQDLTSKNSKLSEIIKNMEFNPNQTKIIESGRVRASNRRPPNPDFATK